MQNIMQYILPIKSPLYMRDDAFHHHYREWDKPSRFRQISAITLLTAILYVIFTFLDKSWASEGVQELMMKVHLLVIVPLLLVISFFAHRKQSYNGVMMSLAAFPILSLSCHAYIASQLDNYGPFLVEGYLGVFWIFIVSGMTLRVAFVSATISSIILLVSGFYLIGQSDLYTMHAFWIFCSFSFGLLGALLFERSRKTIFSNQQELRHMATTDVLTGVFNRSQLNSVLSQEMTRDIRYDKAFGLLMIDIDNFKNVNDVFGHAVGDDVLQTMAKVLSESTRVNDTLVRWGGEEFVVLALEVDEETLPLFCDKLRKQVEKECFSGVGNITVSVGTTLFRKNDTKDSLLSRADKALYMAKEQGRNRTVLI
jgi:diguanylate cyclase (GGDEF)-like protein